MKVLGIIAEYNPFHNGHLHLIKEARERAHFDAVICVMSGNFVQRGEPALCNKWARAEMALQVGIDLVIELPFAFAVRSAYYFARGAIRSLYDSGVVSHIAFGSESGDIEQLRALARVLANETAEYKLILKEKLALGLSYPAARSQALIEHLGYNGEGIELLLSGPNNILGLEYLRIIEELNLNIEPFTIIRKGKTYHDRELTNLASATAIRSAVSDKHNLETISKSMPQASFDILLREINFGRAPVFPNFLEQAVLTRLRTLAPYELQQIYEVSEGLEYRIYEAARSCGTLDSLRQYIKSRRYSLTRINRILLYSILGISKPLINELDEMGPVYLHILGFSDRGKQILQEINKKSPLQVLNRGKDVKRFFEENKGYPPGNMLELDIKSTDIYSLLMPDPSARIGAMDYTTSPIIV